MGGYGGGKLRLGLLNLVCIAGRLYPEKWSSGSHPLTIIIELLGDVAVYTAYNIGFRRGLHIGRVRFV